MTVDIRKSKDRTSIATIFSASLQFRAVVQKFINFFSFLTFRRTNPKKIKLSQKYKNDLQ